MTDADRISHRAAEPGSGSRTPNLDKMVFHGAEVDAARRFVEWLREEKGYDLAKWVSPDRKALELAFDQMDDLLAEWLGVDPTALDEERRWIIRQATKQKEAAEPQGGVR
jgi:hypothetical protein